jgi:hypothetical protein
VIAAATPAVSARATPCRTNASGPARHAGRHLPGDDPCRGPPPRAGKQCEDAAVAPFATPIATCLATRILDARCDEGHRRGVFAVYQTSGKTCRRVAPFATPIATRLAANHAVVRRCVGESGMRRQPSLGTPAMPIATRLTTIRPEVRRCGRETRRCTRAAACVLT